MIRTDGSQNLNESVRADLRTLYRDLDDEIAAAAPRCDASGRCCRFAEYGHTLFLCELEADVLLAPGVPAGAPLDRESCPYQIAGRCTARDRRPVGCRVYFCDAKYQGKMEVLAETYVRRLKDLHDHYEFPWRYRPLHEFLLERTLPTYESSSELIPANLVELT